jgi:cell division protein FtsI (penicillin-binding protein 3)
MRSTPRLHRWVRARILGVAGLITLLFAAIAYRAYGLQIREAEHYRTLAQRQHVATVEVPAPRGVIYDATGAELAVTADIDSIYGNPREIDDLLGTAEKLGQLCGLDAGELEARLASPRQFVWIKRHVGAAEAAAVKAARMPGVYLTPEPRRFYPGRRLAGPVIGFAGIDGRGLDGIELTMNSSLAGKPTSAAAVRDASGDLMLPDLGARPRPGAAVTLTLHRYIQMAAERALEKSMTEDVAKAGVVVVLDIRNGDVLALASWPTYDPNRPGGAREQGARNRAVTDVYEVGSVMKVFTIAAALESGAVTPATTIDVEGGVLQVPGRKPITDTHHDQVLTVGGVLKRSSNVGAVKIARKLGREGLYQALLRYGFGAKTGIELPGEETGLVRRPERWGEIGLAAHAYGYGLSVTPIQVAAAFAAVANGGVYHPPRIVREVRAEGGRVMYLRKPEGHRIISEETAREMRPMMASVFDKGKDGGTAQSLVLDGFRAGGKTGTAHKIDPATGRYAKLYLSSFAGFAPLEDPRVAVLVVIDEPHGKAHFGGAVAGPVWVEVMTATMRYLGVAAEAPAKEAGAQAATGKGSGTGAGAGSQSEPEPADPEPVGEGAPLEEEAPGGVAMPDFTGLGIAQALELARERGIRVEVEGSGRAIAQFPPPGAANKSAECRIVFAHESAAPTRSSP